MKTEQLERSIAVLVIQWLRNMGTDYVPEEGDLIQVRIFPKDRPNYSARHINVKKGDIRNAQA